jgi:lysozyme family protein
VSTFENSFAKLLGHEGDFSDHKDDPGGATRYGVTEAVARANGYTGDMRELPLGTAKTIYRRLYWDAVRADELPPEVRYGVFDAAVNSGPAQALKWLQRAVGAVPDGRIGPQTISMARAAATDLVLRRMLAERLRFMTDLKNWPTFSRGWARRIADLLRE